MYSLLTVGFLMVACIRGDNYVRKLYDFNSEISISDINTAASYMDRSKVVVNADNAECKGDECFLILNQNFNTIARKGYGITMSVVGKSIMNSTIEYFVNDVKYKASFNYLYTTPAVKNFYRVATQNYDSEGYRLCKSKMGTENFQDFDNVFLSGKEGVNWVVAKRNNRVWTASPYSSDATKCNHYWLSGLDICLEKILVARKDHGVASFKMSDDLELELTMQIKYNDKIYGIKYEGNTNEPKVFAINDELNIQMSPIGLIPNPMSSDTISCVYNKNTNSWSKSEKFPCYSTGQLASKGVIPSQGLGRFQVTNLNDLENIAVDSSILQVNDPLVSCSSVKSMKYSEVHKDISSGLQNYFDVDLSETKYLEYSLHSLVLNKENTSTPEVFASDKDCCIRMSSVSNDFIKISMMNYKRTNEVYKSYNQLDDFKLTLVDGIPNLESVRYTSITSQSILTSINSEGLKLKLKKIDAKITDFRIPYMLYFESGAGSYFEIKMKYEGAPGNIQIESESISLLTRELFIPHSGIVEEKIGFKSNGVMSIKPKICVLDENNCAYPEKIDKKTPNKPHSDDGNGDDEGKIKHAETFTYRLLQSNILFTIVNTLCIIMNIFFIIVFMIAILKITKKVGLLFLAIAVNKADAIYTGNIASGIVGTESLIRNVTDQKGVLIISKYVTNIKLFESVVRSYNGPAICHKTMLNDPKIGKSQIDYSFPNPDLLVRTYKLVNSSMKEKSKVFYARSIWMDEKYVYYTLRDEEQRSYNPATFVKCIAEMNEQLKNIRQHRIMFNAVSRGYEGAFGDSTYSLALMDNNNNIFTMEIMDNVDELLSIDLGSFKCEAANRYCELCLIYSGRMYQESILQKIEELLKPSGWVYAFGSVRSSNYIIRNCFIIFSDNNIEVLDPAKDKVIKMKPAVLTIEAKDLFRSINDDITRSCIDKNYVKLNIADKLLRRRDIGNDAIIETGLSDELLEVRTTITTKDVNTYVYSDLVDSCKTPTGKKLKGIIETSIVASSGSISLSDEGTQIFLECDTSTGMAFCGDLDKLYAMKPGSFNINLDEIKMLNKTYRLARGRHSIGFSPCKEKCSGNVFIDHLSNLYCSNDNCIISTDAWNSFSVFDAGRSYGISFTGTFISSYNRGEEKRLMIVSKVDCDYDGFMNAFNCIWKDYPMSSMAFYCFFIVLLILYYTIIVLIYMILGCFRKRTGKMYRTSNRKSMASRMSENLLKGRLNLFKDYEEEGYIPLVNNNVYRGTVVRRNIKYKI